jgi:hypothetical protein
MFNTLTYPGRIPCEYVEIIFWWGNTYDFIHNVDYYVNVLCTLYILCMFMSKYSEVNIVVPENSSGPENTSKVNRTTEEHQGEQH